MKKDTESHSSNNALAELIHARWNPTGGALAAEYWKTKSGLKGFSPVCGRKFQKKAGCQLEKGTKGACRECSVKNYLPLTVKIVKKHLHSTSRKVRFGIYPMIEGNRTAWVALDLDDHVGHKNPRRDLSDLVQVAQALGVPLAAFSSNSGRGFHCYVFFTDPIPAYKARVLLLALIDRADIDLSPKKEADGSFDCVIPKQDALSPGGIGNLIALPWNEHAIEQRKATLYLDPNTLEPYADSRNENIEYFEENFAALSEKDVDTLLSEMGVEARPPREPRRQQHEKSDKNYPPADFDRIVEACPFIEHWKNNAASLGEPAWYAGLTIVARCKNGEELAHKYSKPYPDYTPEETDAKIKHALEDTGPYTCHLIRGDHAKNEGICAGCLIGEGDLITSPINLGTENLVAAQGAVDDLLAAPDPKAAVIEALDSPAVLGNLAIVADEKRGQYESLLMKLREAGVLAKDVAGLEKAVNSERRRRRGLRLVEDGEQAKARTAGEMLQSVDCPSPDVIIPQKYLLKSNATLEMEVHQGIMIPTTIAHAPILITKRLRDDEEGIEHLELKWRRPQGWVKSIEDRGTVMDARRITTLASKGFPVASDRAGKVVKYLHELEAVNLETLGYARISAHLGWQGDRSQRGFLWGRTLISPDGTETVTLSVEDLEPSNWREDWAIAFKGLAAGDEQIADGYHGRGTIEEWKELISSIKTFPKIQLALYSALLPPLLQLIGAPNFTIDFSGRTSIGKTTALRVAASVWGLPDERQDGAIGSWDATKVWLERASAILSGLPVILDDTKRAKYPKMVAEMLYAVSQGRGRGRGNPRSLSRTRTWRTVLLSSGEAPAVSFTQDGGARTRVLSVRGLPFGKDNPETRRLVDHLNNRLPTIYGTAGPAFVRWLLKERDNWPEYEREYRDLVESYANAANSTEGGRLAQCYAALQFTETLAIAAGVTPWSSSKHIESLWLDIAAEAKDAAGEVRALMDIMSWAGSNEHRFDGREVRDKDGSIRAPIQGYAGRWDPDVQEPWDFIGFFPTVLKKVLGDLGYEYEAILSGWREKGWLMLKDGKKRYTRKVRVNGESHWIVTISRDAVKAAEED